jgi:anti-sigma regulatory factor (Ser/Thr protein kinase)
MVVGQSLTLEVRNSRDAIAPASEEAEAWLMAQEPSPEALYFVLLAIEELVTNCIAYAYDDAAAHIVVIVVSVDDEMLTMTVTDDGRPFDPLTVPPPDLSLDIQHRPLGGLGIFLLRELADHVAYERRGRTNRLTLTKRMN